MPLLSILQNSGMLFLVLNQQNNWEGNHIWNTRDTGYPLIWEVRSRGPCRGADLLGIFLIALSCQSLTPSSQDGSYRKCHKPKCQQRLSLDLLINTRLEHFNANVYHRRNVSFYWIARKKTSIILKGHQDWFPSHWARLIIDVTILDFKSPPKTAKLEI